MGASPIRTCAGCRARKPKGELIRVVRLPGGSVATDTGALPGRGAYVCRDEGCIRRACRSAGLARVLRCKAKSLPEGLEEELLGKLKGR